MKLNCHCGAIKIEVAKSPHSLTSCNCSICSRYSALWGYYEPNEVTLTCNDNDLSKYSWGEKSIYFCHCNKCGCVTHYESSPEVENPKTVVNFRMAKSDFIESIKVRKFDGAITWKYIE